MILMGDGVVANVVLDKTKGHAGGWMVVTTAWALAVFVGVVVAAPYSGAHLNPAVTFAFALTGQFPWERVLPYVSAQMIGAALGAVLVWLAYRPHFEATPDPRTKLAVFCTAPEIRRTGWNFLTEMIGTFSLLFIIFYITVGEITLSDNISTLPVGLGSVGALPVAFTVWVIGGRSDGLCDQSCQRLSAARCPCPVADPRQGRKRLELCVDSGRGTSVRRGVGSVAL